MLLAPMFLGEDLGAEGWAVSFHPVGEEAGISVAHNNGATPEKHMAETMGAGGLFFDLDGDDLMDIFLVDSGKVTAEPLSNRSSLYHNLGDGTFADITERSGIRGRGHGMGACAADYDNDGCTDLYLTVAGPDLLYRNLGDGTFVEVSAAAGLGSPLWGTSCAFADYDNDGDLDLFVAQYVDASYANNKYCGDHAKKIRAYCHPNVYNGVPDLLYRNDGDGTFTDVTRQAGVWSDQGKGLGVVFGDYDRDGLIDLYVSNDSVPNFLYHNLGGGRFEEVGLFTGVAVNGDGQREAGMGTDFGDYDNDGLLDLFVTNLDMETNTLYHNEKAEMFLDTTFASRLGEPSLRLVGFGTIFFDADNDGDLDIATANGHILDNAALFRDNIAYAQPNQLFRNNFPAKTFDDVSAQAGPGFALVKVSRALASADYDNDGDLDLLITNNGQTPDLLRNENGNRGNWLIVRLLGTRSNRQGVGAVLRLFASAKSQIRQLTAGSSYLAQSDPRAHFGLGKASQVERLEVYWPSGTVDVIENLAANQRILVTEGKGISDSPETGGLDAGQYPCRASGRKAEEVPGTQKAGHPESWAPKKSGTQKS